MSNVVVTARIDDAVGEQLEALARDLDRPRGWVIARAIERYVAEEGDLIASIKVGEADLTAGRVFTQEQVEAMFKVGHDRRDAA